MPLFQSNVSYLSMKKYCIAPSAKKSRNIAPIATQVCHIENIIENKPGSK